MKKYGIFKIQKCQGLFESLNYFYLKINCVLWNLLFDFKVFYNICFIFCMFVLVSVCSQLCGSIQFSKDGQEKTYDILQLKLQVFAECHICYLGSGICTPAPMIAQQDLLIAETSLQYCYNLIHKEIMAC